MASIKTLHRATLGKAHQWVRSITDTREYALENLWMVSASPSPTPT